MTLLGCNSTPIQTDKSAKPNILIILADQWRIDAFDQLLMEKLNETGDQFLAGSEYVKQWNYSSLDRTETVPN